MCLFNSKTCEKSSYFVYKITCNTCLLYVKIEDELKFKTIADRFILLLLGTETRRFQCKNIFAIAEIYMNVSHFYCKFVTMATMASENNLLKESTKCH